MKSDFYFQVAVIFLCRKKTCLSSHLYISVATYLEGFHSLKPSYSPPSEMGMLISFSSLKLKYGVEPTADAW